ncbi:MAG: 1-deoxy-D-xylulose-5-phosphate synthase [Lachnospiraceae bacterium]|nr:1-deoxy-D-xylulose-5-phosphate synthase [Lachnospiraceae bacterium]
MILEQINQPNDIQKIDPEQYGALAEEIRQFILEKISRTGGHLASNLGVVELTMALHLAFHLPDDKLVWDVGHQSYTHKILTGRREGFDEIRCFGGLSGFPNRRESDCDAFNTGHSSTSISAALGLAQARDLQGGDNYVVAVIGDGALTGGMAYEALNNASRMKRNFIIVLNDNEMSIAENIGGISRALGRLRTAPKYNELKKNVRSALSRTPGGTQMADRISRTKSSIKQLVIPGMIFEDMDLTYLGPVDGYDIPAMLDIFADAKRMDRAVVVHVLTRKGKGYRPAERFPEHFHGIGSFDIETGKSVPPKTEPSYTDIFSKVFCQMAAKDEKIVGITAAMPEGTGLKKFSRDFPDRFFDVGIAEQHGVTFAAGLAAGGMKPYFCVYSSFQQRGFDQVINDVCIQNLNVTLAIDRAGIVGSDGETHQGIFDLSFLQMIPGMTVLAPKNCYELADMLRFSAVYEGPLAIRYPRGTVCSKMREFRPPIENGRSEWMFREGEIALLAVGSMVETAWEVREMLKEEGHAVSLVNARFVAPLDTEMLEALAQEHTLVVTMEENVLSGGFGEHVTAFLSGRYPGCEVLRIAIPDQYVEHGNVSILKKELGLDSESVYTRILARLAEKEETA